MRKVESLPATGLSAPTTREAVRATLEKVLAGETFLRAQRSGRLLRYLVEQTLEGQGEKLKEYSVAIEVFNRPPSFDPHFDPIVRVEAGRLRRKLEEYCQAEGKDDRVVIELPQRTYVPTFQVRSAPAPAPERKLAFWLPSSRRAKILVFGLTPSLLLAGVAAYWMARSFWMGGLSKGTPAAASRQPGTPASAEPPLIAVLPFADVSPTSGQEHFSDGLTEELIEALSKVEGLRVLSRTSAFHFKGKTEDIRKIGQQVKARVVLEGSVRKTGNHVRIFARLINVSDGYHLWSDTFDREVKDAKDVVGIQMEIAQATANALRLNLAGTRGPWEVRRYPRDLETYDLYLKGRHFAGQGAEDGLRKAIEHFELAIQRDPSFGPSYAGMAQTYCLLGAHGAVAPGEVMPKAKAAALKALELDDTDSDAYASLGMVKAAYEWDWAGAEQDFQRALQLDPGDAGVLEAHVMGSLVPTGRLDEALEEMRRAHDLDPVSGRIHSVLGLTYFFRRQYDEAIKQYREALDLAPRFYAARLALGSAYERLSNFEEAVTEFQSGRAAWTGGMGESLLGHAYARMGKRAEAERLLQELKELSKRRYVSAGYLAKIYLGLGDEAQALEWLEKAREQRAAMLVLLKVDPRWESLRSEPRFIALLKEVHLQ